MNYIGKMVYHKALYGRGTITDQDSDNHITVKFDKEPESKVFSTPACFSSFLKLMDSDFELQVKEEIKKHEAKLEEEKIESQKEQFLKIIDRKYQREYSSHSAGTPINEPSYSTVDHFFSEQERLIVSEVQELRKAGAKRIKIFDGEKVELKNGIYIYSFESDSELNLPDNTQISIWQNQTPIPASVINCEEFTLIIATSTYLGERLSVAEFSAETWRLLYFLVDRLKTLQKDLPPIAKTLILDGKKNLDIRGRIKTGQIMAVNMSWQQPVTFVWGPPGTGKTETLASIALEHMKLGHKILILSYSNVSVDGAVMRVFKKASIQYKKPGIIMRYGYPRDKELLRHEYLTSYSYVLSKHPALVSERQKLIKERKTVLRTSSRYVAIGNRLSEIRKLLDAEEKRSVLQAQFVATTVSKAIADSTIYENKFDTVIFDEASMAYIPQIIFSAGLATSHFICMGDFSQLPPIVQSDEKSALNADIFKYCGITDAVKAGYGHMWLCMLDVQYRMHPNIADFSSRIMYNSLLKTADTIVSSRAAIAGQEPMQDKPIGLIDISGMLSVCLKTADQSRINVLSALISMSLAVKTAEKYDVGIISPYSAQSKLLHAMSRDINQKYPHLHNISCATVHQFQGSERDVIIYDTVDCYRMPYPGMLLTSMTNNYANRLYNVALTRARGKFISVVNKDYMQTKKLSENLMFRQFIDKASLNAAVRGNDVISECNNSIIQIGRDNELDHIFLEDIKNAKSEALIDMPGPIDAPVSWFHEFGELIHAVKHNGHKAVIRVSSKADYPSSFRKHVIENHYIANPVAIIDKNIVWFGLPLSNAAFISENKTIPTRYRPAIRFEGRNLARSLYGFLEMNRTIDQGIGDSSKNYKGGYDTFSAYVNGELKCPDCEHALQLKKSKSGKFYLACSNYPHCDHTELVTEDIVMNYFYFNNPRGKYCPRDYTSLQPKLGRYGVYVRCCNGLCQHNYKLDEV